MSIRDIYQMFPTNVECIELLEQVRWHGVPICPYCNSANTTQLSAELRHHCNTCNTTFSVTVGTLFHHTHLPLQKWFLALSLVLATRGKVSGRQLATELEVNKNTAWRLAIRIHNAMAEPQQRAMLQALAEIGDANTYERD